MTKLRALLRRLFKRPAHVDIGLLQVMSPDAKPYVRPTVEEQAAASRAYMGRYYGWMQGRGWPGRETHGYAKGGVLDADR